MNMAIGLVMIFVNMYMYFLLDDRSLSIKQWSVLWLVTLVNTLVWAVIALGATLSF